MTGRTKVLSVHILRRSARKVEREVQGALDSRSPGSPFQPHGVYTGHPNGVEVPAWARGVRVEKAGRFQWAVVATEHRGR